MEMQSRTNQTIIGLIHTQDFLLLSALTVPVVCKHLVPVQAHGRSALWAQTRFMRIRSDSSKLLVGLITNFVSTA